MRKYLPRIADDLLDRSLKASGAVLIEGPKWCGKTSTAFHKAKTAIYMQDPDQRANYLQIASIKPSILLQGDTPRLIDEWQLAPILWDSVRHEVDLRNDTGQFILTGSAVPVLDEKISHTGTGRISRIRMRTMSLFESNDSNGQVSLNKVFEGCDEVKGVSTLGIEKIAECIVRGGWPASLGTERAVYEKRVIDYVDSVVEMDVSSVDGVAKDPQKASALLRSISRNVSTEASMETLRRDMQGGENGIISIPTIVSYLNALQRIFVVEDLEAWNPSIRSKTPLRTSPKRHFVDPSIACASLGISGVKLLKDFKTFGYLFESLCVRDLRVYADYLDGKIYHYRDKTNLECDAVIVLRDGRWGAIEVKMGASEFDLAAENLTKLKDRVNTDKMMEPSFLMILSATDFAYTREDGIHVVPIGCLKW